MDAPVFQSAGTWESWKASCGRGSPKPGLMCPGVAAVDAATRIIDGGCGQGADLPAYAHWSRAPPTQTRRPETRTPQTLRTEGRAAWAAGGIPEEWCPENLGRWYGALLGCLQAGEASIDLAGVKRKRGRCDHLHDRLNQKKPPGGRTGRGRLLRYPGAHGAGSGNEKLRPCDDGWPTGPAERRQPEPA